VVSERCERFRESLSLGLDGMLSTFEAALLARHLDRCAGCRAFSAAVAAQTELLRGAALEHPAEPVVVRPAAAVRFRRRAAGVAGAAAVAAMAALMTLTPTGTQRSAGTTPGVRTPLLEVVPAKPSAEATFEVPRLRVVSPASADGPVRGYYGLPVV
jgi:predicted anti-sigma-YlaC factor YlaD